MRKKRFMYKAITLLGLFLEFEILCRFYCSAMSFSQAIFLATFVGFGTLTAFEKSGWCSR